MDPAIGSITAPDAPPWPVCRDDLNGKGLLPVDPADRVPVSWPMNNAVGAAVSNRPWAYAVPGSLKQRSSAKAAGA